MESGPYSRCDTNDAQSLVSLRLHKQALPTLQLQLMDDSSKRARTSRMPSFGGGAQASEVQVEPGGDERAALDIQRIMRGKHARRQCEDERLWIAVRAMCANTEVRSAERIQRKWRQSRAAVRAAREARELDAAGAIQRVHRNRQRRLNPKRNQAAWLREMIEQAEDSQSEYSQAEDSQSEHSTTRESSPLGSRGQRLSAEALPTSSSPRSSARSSARSSGSSRSPASSPANLTVAFTSVEKTPAKLAQPARTAGAAQVIGVVEKESGFRAWGTWQLVTWSRRWMFITHAALCYRHVRMGSQTPRGKTTSIAFRSVQRVGVHSDEPTVLFLDCATRQYFFRFPSAVLCETFAGRIAVAAAQGGDAQRSDRGTL